jgi:hypothetical protein
MEDKKPIIEFSNNGDITFNDIDGNPIWRMSREATCSCAKITPVDFTEFIPPKKGNEKMRNEVLDLYVSRRREEIKEKYKELIDKEYEELEAVRKYNEIVSCFETTMAELVDEYAVAEGNVPTFVRTGYESDYRYTLNTCLKDEIRKKYREDCENELSEITKLEKEITAMLSISNDKDYQLDVLERYGIIKKGKLTI